MGIFTGVKGTQRVVRGIEPLTIGNDFKDLIQGGFQGCRVILSLLYIIVFHISIDILTVKGKI